MKIVTDEGIKQRIFKELSDQVWCYFLKDCTETVDTCSGAESQVPVRLSTVVPGADCGCMTEEGCT